MGCCLQGEPATVEVKLPLASDLQAQRIVSSIVTFVK